MMTKVILKIWSIFSGNTGYVSRCSGIIFQLNPNCDAFDGTAVEKHYYLEKDVKKQGRLFFQGKGNRLVNIHCCALLP